MRRQPDAPNQGGQRLPAEFNPTETALFKA